MDKEQAKYKIQETFENPFNKDRFITFIKDLLNHIEEDYIPQRQGQYIPDAYRPFISTFERIGKFNDGEKRIDILIIKLQKETSLEHARSSQRNFVAGYLQGKYGSSNEKDAALVAFVAPYESDWRFSLVKMEYKFEKTKTGRMRVKEEFTPARRWSFLVGANENSHTAQSRLVDIVADDEHDPTLARLEEAFNIETVTKEFFLEYRKHFIHTKEALDKVLKNDTKIQSDFETKGINTVDFAKKLLGQIVFLYFLQKKGWFGVTRDANWGAGSKQFLRELFEKKHGDYRNFFNDILEPLFYDALSRDRSDIDHWNDQFKCKIPFLNGGLFDPIGNYDWVHTDIFLPNDLFSNKRKTTEGDTGDGILDIFDRYNFTVKEDEPLEKEVAIDPELLGKAYEKFNAIRPDNFEEYKKALKSGKKGEETKFNKQYGVYYTPREIVHYMCQQSLINYLFTELNSGQASYEKLGDNNLDMFGNKIKKGQLDLTIKHNAGTGILKEDVEMLIHMGEHISENEEIALIKKQKINEGKQKTSVYELKLPESIHKNVGIIDQKLAEITVCDPAVGSGAFPVGMMSEIVKARNVLTTSITNKEKRKHYDFKRQCIEYSLYGVDIDPGAVEIAKLRLWLSLVVDEEDIQNIKPLPNLDYKIVCGNSLLGYPYTPMGLEKIEKLKEDFFGEVNPTRKNELRKQIDNAIYILFEDTKKTLGYKVTMDFKINFSEVFRNKNGFDVVIANPPFIDSEQMVQTMQELREQITQKYKTAKGNWDFYIPFWEMCFSLLENNGTAVLITPNKWLSIGYGKELRTLLKKYVYQVGNCNKIKVFEAGNSPVIVHIKKEQTYTDERIVVNIFDQKYQIRDIIMPNFILDFDDWGILLSEHVELIIRMGRQNMSVCDEYFAENPFTVGEAYELKNILYDLRNMNEYNKSKHFKFVNTGTIDKFTFLWGLKPTTYIKEKYQFPVIDRNIFKAKLNRRYVQMNSPKIIISGMRHFECMIDSTGDVIAGKSSIILKVKRNKDLNVILGILNSKLITFYIKERYGTLGIDGGINFTANLVEQLPLPSINSALEKKIQNWVDQIISLTRSNDYLQNPRKQDKVKVYEKQIDQLVYRLYGLAEEEIKIVEDSL